MSVLATICARGGSTGVPGKNIRPLNGKPLIAYTIEQALSCNFIDAVVVSTDSDEIAEVARRYGAEVPFKRPAELATASAPKVPVIGHIVDTLAAAGRTYDVIVDLDPTSPLRIADDIRACCELYGDDTDLVITAFESEKNPYFNMVEYREDGSVGLVKPPGSEVFGRQHAPKVYSMNGSVYVWRPSVLGGGLWNCRVKLYEMPRERSIDIDSEIDFQLVELLMTKALASERV